MRTRCKHERVRVSLQERQRLDHHQRGIRQRPDGEPGSRGSYITHLSQSSAVDRRHEGVVGATQAHNNVTNAGRCIHNADAGKSALRLQIVKHNAQAQDSIRVADGNHCIPFAIQQRDRNRCIAAGHGAVAEREKASASPDGLVRGNSAKQHIGKEQQRVLPQFEGWTARHRVYKAQLHHAVARRGRHGLQRIVSGRENSLRRAAGLRGRARIGEHSAEHKTNDWQHKSHLHDGGLHSAWKRRHRRHRGFK